MPQVIDKFWSNMNITNGNDDMWTLPTINTIGSIAAKRNTTGNVCHQQLIGIVVLYSMDYYNYNK